jgi:hypothetical protein
VNIIDIICTKVSAFVLMTAYVCTSAGFCVLKGKRVTAYINIPVTL